MRKVHHPKIVQRSDAQWVVACDDCARAGGTPRPMEIDLPVESLRKARALWESHYERACGPVPRRAFEEDPRDKVLIVTKSTMTKWWWPH